MELQNHKRLNPKKHKTGDHSIMINRVCFNQHSHIIHPFFSPCVPKGLNAGTKIGWDLNAKKQRIL
jgi:hypothetical protein